MKTEARHRLKQDPFAEGTREIFDWIVDHRVNLIGGVVIAGVIIAVYLGWFFHSQGREQQASLQLAQAMRTFNTPIGPAEIPGGESYASASARDQAAEKKLQAVAKDFGRTTSGKLAGYYIGIVRMDAGDNTGAEQQLKQVAGSGDKDLAGLAKLALASLYVSSGQDSKSVPLLNDLIAHPTTTVSKEQAQLALGEAYAQKQPQEAMRIYQQIETSDPASPAAEVAMDRMLALKK